MTDEGMEEAIRAMKRGRGWMKFLAVLSILCGAAYCLSIFGAVVGWIPIWLGILLLQAGEQADKLEKSREEGALAEYVRLINKMMRIAGIIKLVVLILSLTVTLAVLGYFLVTKKDHITIGGQSAKTIVPYAVEKALDYETKRMEKKLQEMQQKQAKGKRHVWATRSERYYVDCLLKQQTYATKKNGDEQGTIRFDLEIELDLNREKDAGKYQFSDEYRKLIRQAANDSMPVVEEKLREKIGNTPAEELALRDGEDRIREWIRKILNEEIKKKCPVPQVVAAPVHATPLPDNLVKRVALRHFELKQ